MTCLAMITDDLAALATFVAAAAALAAIAGVARRRRARRASRPAGAARAPAASWRGSAALATAVAAGMLLAPPLVALRQLYPLPEVGGRTAAALLILMLLVTGAVLAVVFADPGEDA